MRRVGSISVWVRSCRSLRSCIVELRLFSVEIWVFCEFESFLYFLKTLLARQRGMSEGSWVGRVSENKWIWERVSAASWNPLCSPITYRGGEKTAAIHSGRVSWMFLPGQGRARADRGRAGQVEARDTCSTIGPVLLLPDMGMRCPLARRDSTLLITTEPQSSTTHPTPKPYKQLLHLHQFRPNLGTKLNQV